MKIKLLPFLALSAFLLFSSFRNTDVPEGALCYAVSKNDPSAILLQLNPDGSFVYRDLSNPKKPLNLKGSWSKQGQRYLLKSESGEKRFHRVWDISENGSLAKSRRGLCFYRICRVE